METLQSSENLRCTLCKTNETSKWHFSLDDNMLYCIMCYYQAKSRGKIREADVFEVINNCEAKKAEEKHESDMYEMIDF
ncbi:unnamed protein product [Auanema sp. JU1783]|nr:unnamed protein product [Auanema sp. JU1783]